MTTPKALDWSAPSGTVYTVHRASDGDSQWRTVAVPRDVTRIHFVGRDRDGTIVNSTEAAAYGETTEEARIVVDALRAGTDHLPGWREQLEAAGFSRTYPDEADGVLSGMWNDIRRSGRFEITVHEGVRDGARGEEVAVHATYHAQGANSWHNVCRVDGSPENALSPDRDGGRLRVRQGLPEGVDALKAGVAAALAIRAARIARGGRFSNPLGGPTRARG